MKVLMVLMKMEIGGAETHVLELCKALKKRNIEVLVVSNGGIYERELKKNKIRYFHAPLHNKNIINLIISYIIIRNIIKNNKIKLVHAHGRIPAFVCGILKKKLCFRFVTTAHWVFKTGIILNVLTNWGEKTLAVSEDIKKYLLDNYNINEKNISLTVNGIDTEKFSELVNYSDIVSEFNFNKNKKHILCVSRLDKSRSLSTEIILKIAFEICNKYNAEIIIVGDGDNFINLKKQAELINKNFGAKIIYFVGARIDINKFLALADIFIGVSRAALEAMSSKKPVILFGNEGYMGIFEAKKFDDASKNNFCCRNFDNKINIKELKLKLKDDIEKIFLSDKKYLDEIKSYEYSIIKKYYSADKMADDAIEVYNSLRAPSKKKIDVIISGYYGFNNNGDDCVLKAIIENLKKSMPEIKILVLSNRPLETKKIYEVDSIYRFNYFLIKKYMKNTNLLISGGGSLIQDLTSTHSLRYYLWIINIALKNSVRIMLYANGIGPIVHKKNKKLIAKIINQVDLITLRDRNSYLELKKLKINKPEIKITADAAFSLEYKSANLISHKKKYFIISVRRWKYNSNEFEKNIAVFANYIIKKYNLIAVLIPMHPNYDVDISKKIKSFIQKDYAKYIGVNYDTNYLLDLIYGAEFILAMRFHTIIYAIQTATPILGLSYDPKVKSIMQEINQDFYLDVRKINIGVLKDMAKKILINQNKISIAIKNHCNILRKKSLENTKLALELLNKPLF